MGCEEERYYIGRVARLIFAKWRFVSLQIMTSTPFWFGDDGIGQALPASEGCPQRTFRLV